MDAKTVELKFNKIRNKLDELGYHYPLPVEALPIADKLLADLLKTTDSLKVLTECFQQLTKENEAFKSSYEPLKEENGKLVKENQNLFFSIAELKLCKEQILREGKAQTKSLEEKNFNLTIYKDQCCRKIERLEKELKEKTKCFKEMQDKFLFSKSSARMFPNSWRFQKMEITSRIDPLPSQSQKVFRQDVNCIDLIKLHEEKIENYKQILKQLKITLSEKDMEIERLKTSLLSKTNALNELCNKVGDSLPDSIIGHKHISDRTKNDVFFQNLLKHVDALTKENRFLHKKYLCSNDSVRTCDAGTSICSDMSDEEFNQTNKCDRKSSCCENVKEKLATAFNEIRKAREHIQLLESRNKRLEGRVQQCKSLSPEISSTPSWTSTFNDIYTELGTSNFASKSFSSFDEFSSIVSKDRLICHENFKKVKDLVRTRSEILARYSGGLNGSNIDSPHNNFDTVTDTISDKILCCCSSVYCVKCIKSSENRLLDTSSQCDLWTGKPGADKPLIEGVESSSRLYLKPLKKILKTTPKRVSIKPKTSARSIYSSQPVTASKKAGWKLNSQILQTEIKRLKVELLRIRKENEELNKRAIIAKECSYKPVTTTEEESNKQPTTAKELNKQVTTAKQGLNQQISTAEENLTNVVAKDEAEKKTRKELHDAKKIIKQYEGKISDLCSRNETLDVQKRKLEQQLNEVKRSVELGKDEIRKMVDRNQIYPSLAYQDRVKRLENDCRNWEKKAKEYREEAEKIRNRMKQESSNLTNEVLKLRSQVENLKMENHRLIFEQSTYQGEMQSQYSLQHNLDSELSAQVEKVKALQKRLGELEIECGKYRNLYVEVHREYKFLQEEVNQKQCMMNENNSALSEAKRDLRSTKDKLFEVETKFEKSDCTIRSLNEQIKVWKEKVKRKEEEIEDLQCTLKEKDYRQEDIAAMKQSSEKSLKQALHDLSEKQEEISHLQHHISRLDMEIRDLKNENRALVGENRRIQHDMSVVLKDSKCLSKDLENARDECNRLKSNMQEYCNEVRRFQELIQTKEKEQQELMEQYKNLTLETSSFMAQRAAFEDDYNSLRQSLEEKIQELNKVMETISIQDQEIQEYMETQAMLEDQINRLRKDCKELESRLTNITRERDSAFRDLNRLKDYNYDLQVTHETLRQKLFEAETKPHSDVSSDKKTYDVSSGLVVTCNLPDESIDRRSSNSDSKEM